MTFDPSDVASAGLVQRVRRVLLEPHAEFDRIAAEPAEVNKLYTGYVLPLAVLAAVCTFVGHLLFLRFGLVSSLVEGAFLVLWSIAGAFILAFVSNALAPTFGAEQNIDQAHKLAVYSYTAALLAGVFMLVPMLAWLALLGFYSIGLFYIGAPRLMKVPEDKRIGYVAVVFIACIVVMVVLSLVLSPLRNLASGYGQPGPRFSESARTVSDSASIDLGMIQREVAQRSGPPVNPARLQDQLPRTLPSGFTLVTESASAADDYSRAEGVYESGAARLKVSIVQLSTVEAVSVFATGLEAQADHRDAGGYARTQSINGRFYSEEVNNDGSASYAVIGRGVAISAEGTGGVTLDQARAAIEIIDVQRLESEFGA